MTCRIGEIEAFDHDDIYHARTECCNSRMNHWDKPVKLDKPKIFGAFDTKTQKVFTHECRVKCKCGRTSLIMLGTIRKDRGFICSVRESP